MSKFARTASHKYGTYQPHIEKLNFGVLLELDNMTAKTPVYKELPESENPYIKHCATASDCKCEEEVVVVIETKELHEMYKEDTKQTQGCNPLLVTEAATHKTDVRKFLKKQNAIKW